MKQQFRSKYHAKKTVRNGITFDSKHEADRWDELKILEAAGMIQQLKRQVRFELIPSQRGETGKVIERSVTYKADFTYLQNGRFVVEDAKGVRTPEYIIKRKLMLWVHKIKVREV